MWANMFPGDSSYYSGAIRPREIGGARWNWGVVTTEWTSNELLQDKWEATWEMWKSSHAEWREGSAATARRSPRIIPVWGWVCECLCVCLFVDNWRQNTLKETRTLAPVSLSELQENHVIVRCWRCDLGLPGVVPSVPPPLPGCSCWNQPIDSRTRRMVFSRWQWQLRHVIMPR